MFSEENLSNFERLSTLPILTNLGRKKKITSNMIEKIHEEIATCQKETADNHMTAMKLARQSYSLEEVTPGIALSERSGVIPEKIFKSDGEEIKSGYSGFTAVQGDKFFIASTGTNEAFDWLSNAQMGENQFTEMRDKIKDEAWQKLLSGKEVYFTGHSLGGALSQAFSMDLGLKIREAHRSGNWPFKEESLQEVLSRVHTVGWNAFGMDTPIRTKLFKDIAETPGDSSMIIDSVAQNRGYSDNIVLYGMGADPLRRVDRPVTGVRRDIISQGIVNQRAGVGTSVNFEPITVHNFPAIDQAIFRNGLDTSVPVKPDQDYTIRVASLFSFLSA